METRLQVLFPIHDHIVKGKSGFGSVNATKQTYLPLPLLHVSRLAMSGNALNFLMIFLHEG